MSGKGNIFSDNKPSARKGQIYNIKLTDVQFKKLSSFLQSETGIKLPEVKKIMLQSRLYKRLRALEMENFDDYINYALKKGNEQEIINMIDVVSTNKTDFFREPGHFDFLTNEYIPYLAEKDKSHHFKIWCAASSSGEEPYTLAITCENAKKKFPGLNYSILATDISTQMLDHGRKGIYSAEKVAQLPMSLKKEYFLRSVDQKKPTVKVVPKLQSHIMWSRLNLMDDYYTTKDKYDLVICRNVLIYFERHIQEQVINKLCRHLKPGGIFILGHSESIINMNVPLKQLKPTIYKLI